MSHSIHNTQEMARISNKLSHPWQFNRGATAAHETHLAEKKQKTTDSRPNTEQYVPSLGRNIEWGKIKALGKFGSVTFGVRMCSIIELFSQNGARRNNPIYAIA